MKSSESQFKISKSLVAFAAEVENPGKDSRNPHFKSYYTSLPGLLNHVRPLLAKHGMAAFQSTQTDETGRMNGVVTRIVHESGEWLESEPVLLKTRSDDAQGAGSSISYARRYSLLAALNLAGEDDDGNASVQEPRKGSEITDAFDTADAESKRRVSAEHLAVFSKRLNDLTFVDEPKALFTAITAEMGDKKSEMLPTHLEELVRIYNDTKKAVEAKGAKK